MQIQLLNKNIDFIAFDRQRLNITNFDVVKNVISAKKPNIVINCAAYNQVDMCESDTLSAFCVNAVGPRNLAIATQEIGSTVIHISTDYVFDGKTNRPYKEYDLPNPQSVYGKSKYLGETNVCEYNPNHFIIRTAWLYGNGNNFVRLMLKLASEKKHLKIVTNQIGTPTNAVDLAQSIINLMETECYGIYHGSCEGSCTRYEFTKTIFDLKKINIDLIPIEDKEFKSAAIRPNYSVLDNEKLRSIGLNTYRHWHEALEEYLREG